MYLSKFINILNEDLRAKISFLQKQYKIDDNTIKLALSADPTDGKKYLAWIVREIKKIGIHKFDRQNANAMFDLLRLFNKYRQFLDERDILKYDLYSLHSALTNVQTLNLISKRAQNTQDKLQGAKIVFKEADVTILEITTPEACLLYTKHTKLCVSDIASATAYTDEGSVYLFFIGNAKVALYSLVRDEMTDIFDNDTDSVKNTLSIDEQVKIAKAWIKFRDYSFDKRVKFMYYHFPKAIAHVISIDFLIKKLIDNSYSSLKQLLNDTFQGQEVILDIVYKSVLKVLQSESMKSIFFARDLSDELNRNTSVNLIKRTIEASIGSDISKHTFITVYNVESDEPIKSLGLADVYMYKQYKIYAFNIFFYGKFIVIIEK